MSRKTGPSGETSATPWSEPVAVADIPDEGMHRALEAPADAREKIAALAGVPDVLALNAELDLMRNVDAVHVSGRVRGRVGQNCVVTLEPIETEIDEEIDVTYAPPPAGGEPRRRDAAEDVPEPLTGSHIDLGVVATEFLILGIDPYPRKAGVEFTPPAVENDAPHPFAALEALKNRPGGGKSSG